MHESERPLTLLEIGQHVRHRDQNGESRAPALGPVARAEAHAGLDDVRRRSTGLEEPEDRLGDDEGDALFQAFAEAVTKLRELVGRRDDENVDLVVRQLDRVGSHIVGKGVECAPRGQVEARMVPVARQQALVHGAPMERKAHMRATVVDGKSLLAVPEDADGPRADLCRQAPCLAKLVHRADPMADPRGAGCRNVLHAANSTLLRHI